jgi:GNAT superfamily N-acetyltransferase
MRDWFRLLLALFSLILLRRVASLSSVRVSPVRNAADICALADVRYDEWMEPLKDPPSRFAFRQATAELYEERAAQGALSFLARLDERKQDTPVVVGAAELSPAEIEHTIIIEGEGAACSKVNQKMTMLYVTDVVTDKNHRRKGVAAALMHAMEQKAADLGALQLLLHVAQDNAVALSFYERIGYQPPSTDLLKILDVDRLARNAGTIGQAVLCKAVVQQQVKDKPRRRQSGGFGAGGSARTGSHH